MRLRMRNGSPRRSPKPKNVIHSQICCLKVSKWEFELGNQNGWLAKVSGRLLERFWITPDPFLARPGAPTASKRPEIKFLHLLWATCPIYSYFCYVPTCLMEHGAIDTIYMLTPSAARSSLPAIPVPNEACRC